VRSLLPSRRVAIPLVLAAICLMLAGSVPPIATLVLVVAAFGLVLDAGLAMMPTTGSLDSHKQ